MILLNMMSDITKTTAPLHQEEEKTAYRIDRVLGLFP